MAEDPNAEEAYSQQHDDEGGPIKSFLEHLEDLRWVLIKSLSAFGVAFLVCLLGGNYLVGVLELPLARAPVPSSGRTVDIFFGTNHLGSFHPGTNEPAAVLASTNELTQLEIVPLTIGTNQLLGLRQRDSSAPVQRRLPIEIVNFSPAGSFVVATKVAFYGGILIASPFIFYFVASFVFPALKMREKKYVYRGLFFGVGLFLTGVCFCYFVLMPIALAASAQYAHWLGFSTNQWRAEDYIAFVCKFMLGMGLGFELPVVILTMVKLGVLSYRVLASARRYVIVISFVLGAVLTTPEVITQVLMALPLLLLYEISVWIAWYWEKKEQRAAAKSG